MGIRRFKDTWRGKEGKKTAECVWSSDKASSAAAYAVSHKADGLFLGQASLNGWQVMHPQLLSSFPLGWRPLWCRDMSRFHSRDVLSCNGKGRGGTDNSSRRDLVAEDSTQRCFNGMLTAISSSPRVRHIAANNVKRLLSAVVATQDQSQRWLIHWFPLSRRALRGVCRTVLPCGTDTFEKFDLPLLGFKPHMLRH